MGVQSRPMSSWIRACTRAVPVAVSPFSTPATSRALMRAWTGRSAMIVRPSPCKVTGPRVTSPMMVQPMGGVTFSSSPKTRSFCGGMQRGSGRLIVHKVRGTAFSIAARRASASASIGTAMTDVSRGTGTGSDARCGARSVGFCWQAASSSRASGVPRRKDGQTARRPLCNCPFSYSLVRGGAGPPR